jgi:branched-chain amino acid transport system permease protein
MTKLRATRYKVIRGMPATRATAAVGVAVVVILVTMPWWAGRGELRLATEFLYTLALAQLWNFLAGYGGLLSVGQQAFVGIGGYSMVALALIVGLNPFLAVPLAGLVAAVIAVPVAAVVFRLNGAYFAIGTWVVAEIFMLLVKKISVLGGGLGLSIGKALQGIPYWWLDAMTLWTAIILGVGSIIFLYLLLRSRYGLALTAIRDSVRASQSLGVKVNLVKLMVYVVAAFGVGMTGALIFLAKLRITPDSAFTVDWTATMFFIVVIGGIGTLEGPIVGVLIYFILREVLSDYGSAYMIVLGGATVVIMVLAPKGVWGVFSRRFDVRLFAVQRKIAKFYPAIAEPARPA